MLGDEERQCIELPAVAAGRSEQHGASGSLAVHLRSTRERTCVRTKAGQVQAERSEPTVGSPTVGRIALTA